MDNLDFNKKYSYADYITWESGSEGDVYELVDGFAYHRSAPNIKHVLLVGEVFRLFSNALRGRSCSAFVSLCDVRLNYDSDDDTVIQPDVMIVCDPGKWGDGVSFKGAPDFIVEVLSSATARHDMVVKLELYQRYGVKEYWIVDPNSEIIITNVLSDGKYSTTICGNGQLQSASVSGIEVDIDSLFKFANDILSGKQ